MTKADLIEDVARKTELSRKDSEVIVDTIFEGIVKSLRGGDKIEIRGLGSFRTRHRNSRVGRTPKPGEPWNAPASTTSSRLGCTRRARRRIPQLRSRTFNKPIGS